MFVVRTSLFATAGSRIPAAALWLALALFIVITASAATVLPARAADPADIVQARTMLNSVFSALASGDPAKVAPLLAPEFQVVRFDGTTYGRDDYLARSIPRITGGFAFSDVRVTRNDDILVARFTLEMNDTIDGKRAERLSPQLIVFRLRPDGFQVIAAANFARLTPVKGSNR